jgi:signal transduction histidine kinase
MDNHLEAGQFVEIEGSATPGGFGPTLLPSKITVLGRGKLPEPLRCSWDQLMTGREDSQWIEIVGRAQSITNQYLNVLTDGGMVQVAVENCSASLMNQWINTTLRIQGACAPFHVDGQVRGFVLRCPSPASVQNVHTQPENPFQIPSQPIKTVREYNALDRFFKIEGVVTYRDARSFFIQDATGGARVRDVVSSKMNVGDWVQVVGFPETSGYSPVLSEATTRLIGKTAKLQPLSITTAAIQSGNFDACLVRLEGIFLEQRTNSAGNQLLALETDDRVVEATLATDAGPLPALLKGSRLAVSGVCLNKSDHLLEDNQQVSSFDLFVSSSGQVVVLQQPAWWTLQRVMGAMAFLASGLFIALVWIRLLQRQVNERTRNLKLEIESHKRTESHLENEIEERKRIQIENEDIHKRLLIASRHAGMAEVAAGVLHHVGNIFNSINISANIIVEKLQRSKIGMIAKVSGLLKEHAGDLGTFLGQDEKGKKLPAYLEALGATIKAENHELQKEMDSLREHLKQVHQIVAMQEKYIHVTAVLETVPAGEVAGDAIKLIALEFERQGVGLVRDWADTPAITVDKYKFMEILANLLSNALQACNASNRSNKRVVVKIFQVDSDKVKIVVSDNGIGILPKNLTRLFAFPTIRQSGGHGYGLHNSANAAKEMGGGLTARSDGPGQGSAFTVEMPIQAGARK